MKFNKLKSIIKSQKFFWITSWLILLLSSLVLTPFITDYSLKNNKHSNQKIDNTIQKKSNNFTMNGDFVVDSSSKTPINGETNNVTPINGSPKTISGGERGILVPYSDALRYVDANTGQVLWTVKDDVWENNNRPNEIASNTKLGDTNHKRHIIASYYSPSMDAFVVVSNPGTDNTNKFIISTVRESDGFVYSVCFEGPMNLNPVQMNTFLISPVVGTSNCFIIAPGFYTTFKMRNKFTIKIWISDYSASFTYNKNFSFGDWNGDNKHVLWNFSTIYTKKFGDIYFTYELYSNGIRFIRLFKENTKYLRMETYAYGCTPFSDPTGIEKFMGGPHYVNGVYFNNIDDYNFQLLHIRTDWNLFWKDSEIVAFSFNLNKNGDMNDYVSLFHNNLNNSYIDWDIESGRIIQDPITRITTGNFFTSYDNAKRNRYIRLRMDDWNLNDDNGNNLSIWQIINSTRDGENGPNERVSVWDLPQAFINDNFPIVIPLINDNQYNKVFFAYDNMYKNIGCFDINNPTGGYGYITNAKLPNIELDIPNPEEILSVWDKNKIINFLNTKINDIFTRYTNSSKIIDLSNIIYNPELGQIICEGPKISNAFNNEGKYVNELQFSKETTIKIKGFFNKSTTLKVATIQADGKLLKYSTKKLANAIGTIIDDKNSNWYNTLKKWMHEKKDILFENLPSIPNKKDFIDFGENTGEVVNYNNESITFKFTVAPMYLLGTLYKDFNEVKDNGLYKHFEITITGFKDLSTSIETDVIVENSQLIYKKADEISDQELKDYFYLNKNKYIINCPVELTISDISLSERENLVDDGIITIKITLSKFYNEYGELNSSGDTLSEYVNFHGFKTDSTVIKSEIAINGFSATNGLETKAPYEINKIDVRSLIIKSQNDIFKNLPQKLNEQNVIVNDISIKGSTIIYINTTIPAKYKDQVINKNFGITIFNLKNKDTNVRTEILTNGIVADDTIRKYLPNQIKRALDDGINTSKDSIYYNVANFIFKNVKNIFNYIPSLPSSNPNSYISLNGNKFYEFVESTNESITIKFTIKKYYKNGKEINDWNIDRKKWEIKIIGLGKNGLVNDSSTWIWIIVGVVSGILLIMLLTFIIVKIRRRY